MYKSGSKILIKFVEKLLDTGYSLNIIYIILTFEDSIVELLRNNSVLCCPRNQCIKHQINQIIRSHKHLLLKKVKKNQHV